MFESPRVSLLTNFGQADELRKLYEKISQGTMKKIAPWRPWLLQLFQALEIKEGGEVILVALREMREKFKTVVGKRE